MIRGGWTSTCMAYYASVWENSGMQLFFSARSSEVKGEQLQAATSGLCEGQKSVLSSSVDREELAISYQLFRFT